MAPKIVSNILIKTQHCTLAEHSIQNYNLAHLRLPKFITLQVLLDAGADVNCCDVGKRTALRAAAWGGHLEVRYSILFRKVRCVMKALTVNLFCKGVS